MEFHLAQNCKLLLVSKDDFKNLASEGDLSHFFKATVGNFPTISQLPVMHFERKKEFILGRFLAYQLYQELTSKTLSDLESGPDRSPTWPTDIVGSIAHNKDFVCVAIAYKLKVRSIGLDLEVLKRGSQKIKSKILIEDDLKNHPSFSEDELVTFIFSAKEALFKLLYPIVKKFFGFDYAYVSFIDINRKSFKIHLKKDLDLEFNLNGKASFDGHFELINGSVLTFIKLDH